MLSRIPAGLRYYTGVEARLRRFVEDTAMSVFEGWSYEEVITPTVDYYSLFEQGMGEAEAQTSFRFSDADGRMLSLRPDVTSSVARLVATLLSERPRPLRLCYAAPVFRRQEQSHAEWRRENTQLGCELIGASGDAGDLEVLLVAAEILTKIGLTNSFRITINDVGIFEAIANEANLDQASKEMMRRLIDTRDQAELSRFLDSRSLPVELSGLAQLTGQKDVLDRARGFIANPRAVSRLTSLESLWTTIETLGMDRFFEIDLADVSSLDYYTGLSFKVYVRGIGYRVGRGGRYDGLTANFGRSEPAVGFVLNLDSLTEVLGREARENGGGESDVVAISRTDLSSTFREALRRRKQNEKLRID
jgi:ATP phosphoribosyltransferase regulatory subunit